MALMILQTLFNINNINVVLNYNIEGMLPGSISDLLGVVKFCKV